MVIWQDKISELEELSKSIKKGGINDNDHLLERLTEIFPEERKIVKETDVRVIYLIEYFFYRAGGPYAPTFEEFLPLIKFVLEIHPAMKDLLNRSANHALANMALGARGKLKFEINDKYELMKVLRAWKDIGLQPCSQRSVFQAILRKPSIVKRIQKQDLYLLARLTKIFPQWKKEINPQGLAIQEEIFNQQKSRFEPVLKLLKSRGLALEDMIEHENARQLPIGVKRNNFLSYLLKVKHNFTCQLADKVTNCRGKIQSHHINPLSKGGENKSFNIIVLCNAHHKAVHLKKLPIFLVGSPAFIKVIDGNKSYRLDPN